jgi:uncharacterized protein (DUF2141 family)
MKLIIAACIFNLFFGNLSKTNITETPKASLVEIEITIKNIKTTNGKLMLGVFKDHPSFEKEQPFKSVQANKSSAANGVLKVKTQLEPGIYGLSLLDDENGNSKMDYNFVGIPKEGFGFSNYYHTAFSKPKFQSFQFEVKENSAPKIEMVVRYM